MTTATLALPRLRLPAQARSTTRRRHVPIESTLIWVVSFGAYIAAASFIVFHLDYLPGDGAARVANGYYVLFSRDPHLGAIAGVWPPLPAFLDIPILVFKGLWPPLATYGFAGCIESAAFGAGTVVLLNVALRWAGVVRGMRWLICAAWVLNPEIALYNTSGMAEPLFIFFGFASALTLLRWCESRRSSLLPLLGVLVGLGCLCRVDMFGLALFVGGAVLVRSVRRGGSWRQVETRVLLYALPGILTVMLWIGSLAVLDRNPLFFLSQYSNATVIANNNFLPATSWGNGLSYVVEHALVLFPAVVPLLLFAAVRLVVRRDRLPGLLLLGYGLPVAALDVYLLHKGEMSASLRYQMFVIPFTFLLAVYVLRGLRGRRRLVQSWVALALLAMFGLSDMVTGQTMGDAKLAMDESPIVSAIAAGSTVPAFDPYFPGVSSERKLSAAVAAADTDHGLVAVDTTQGFWVVLTAPDPRLYVVSSDLDFQGAIAQPQVYHVEYFLVAPYGLDQLNQLYPGLYSSGAGFSTLVADLPGRWKLYRITGPTGRG
jgi:hypothetical protein